MGARGAMLVAAAGCLAFVSAVRAEATDINITATIRGLAQFRVASSPPALEITPQDIQRGYVDVALPSVVVARTNLPEGFSVLVLLDPQLVVAATVTGLDQIAHIPGASGRLRVPESLQETRYELRWRLQLAPAVQPGHHAWPVQLRFDGL